MTPSQNALTTFLHARLNEDEQAARAAAHGTSGEWTTEGSYPVSVAGGLPEDADVFDRAVAFDEGSPSEEQAAHIARHDPARVLREVEAKRRIVYAYENTPTELADPGYEEGAESTLYYVLQLLALPYADRPGYREEWRP